MCLLWHVALRQEHLPTGRLHQGMHAATATAVHSKGGYLNKRVLAVKVDVAIHSCRDGGVARGDSQLPPVLLPVGCIQWQRAVSCMVLDLESRLGWTWRGLHAKVLAQQLAATGGWVHPDLHHWQRVSG